MIHSVTFSNIIGKVFQSPIVWGRTLLEVMYIVDEDNGM